MSLSLHLYPFNLSYTGSHHISSEVPNGPLIVAPSTLWLLPIDLALALPFRFSSFFCRPDTEVSLPSSSDMVVVKHKLEERN